MNAHYGTIIVKIKENLWQRSLEKRSWFAIIIPVSHVESICRMKSGSTLIISYLFLKEARLCHRIFRYFVLNVMEINQISSKGFWITKRSNHQYEGLRGRNTCFFIRYLRDTRSKGEPDMEKHTEHKLLHKAIDRISYRHHHEQALSSFKEKKRRYLSMNEDEFLLSYIEISMRCICKKWTLFFS